MTTPRASKPSGHAPAAHPRAAVPPARPTQRRPGDGRITELGHIFADAVEHGLAVSAEAVPGDHIEHP